MFLMSKNSAITAESAVLADKQQTDKIIKTVHAGSPATIYQPHLVLKRPASLHRRAVNVNRILLYA